MSDLSVVDVFDLLHRAGIQRARSASGGREANFSCAFPGHSHGDESPSAYMNVETTAWFCWGCKRRGNAISFWSEVMGVSVAEARRFLAETYGIAFREPIGGSMASEIDMHFAPPMELAPIARPSGAFLASCRLDWVTGVGVEQGVWDYMTGRGFTTDTLVEWDVGYDYQSNLVTIPVYDVDGELVGLKGRAWEDGDPRRYIVMGDSGTWMSYGFPPYEASQVVFGLHRRRSCRTVVLNEGELDPIACWQVGVERPIGLGMSYLSDRHLELIAREADEVIVFLDPDAAGEAALRGYIDSAGQKLAGVVERLEPYVITRVVQGHEMDAADYVRAGRGSEIVELIERAPSSLYLTTLLR